MAFLRTLFKERSYYKVSDTCQIPNLSKKWEDLFGRTRKGSFVEVGAFDGESFSNTSCLADKGWAGLYVEPITEFAKQCQERHSRNSRVQILNLAASNQKGTATIFIGGSLTTLIKAQVDSYQNIEWAQGLHAGEQREVETDCLDSILESHAIAVGFDLLTIDVEGAEEQVMEGFDIPRWQPKVIVIELEDEHKDFQKEPRILASCRRVRQMIECEGYKTYYRDQINTIYTKCH